MIDFGATVAIPEYNSILVVDVALPHASFVGRIEIFRVIPWINTEAGSSMGVGPQVEGHSDWAKWLRLCWTPLIKFSVWLQALRGGKLDLTGLVKRKFYFPAIIAWGREGE